MSDAAVTVAVASWIHGLTGVRTQLAHLEEKRPDGPYITVDLTNSAATSRHKTARIVRDPGDPEDPEAGAVAYGLLDWEWVFSINAYRGDPSATLRRIRTALEVTQACEPLMPEYLPHTASNIRVLHEQVHNRWEDRAQLDLTIRGNVRDDFAVDLIETVEFDIAPDQGD